MQLRVEKPTFCEKISIFLGNHIEYGLYKCANEDLALLKIWRHAIKMELNGTPYSGDVVDLNFNDDNFQNSAVNGQRI